LQEWFYERNFEIPIKSIRNTLYARVSIHLYNTFEDIDKFVLVLKSRTLADLPSNI
jgi:selenocysteine lyase/cysteine desulfurase